LSNNKEPAFTDHELVCIWFFGHLSDKFQKKQIYDFILDYWAQWFPRLPSYQTFVYRLNLLEQSFQTIGIVLFKVVRQSQTPELDHLIDSFPVMLAGEKYRYTNAGYVLLAAIVEEVSNFNGLLTKIQW